MKHRIHLAVLLLLATTSLADTGPLGFGDSALETSMKTDRPDFTEGTHTIQAGHLQIESGYTYTKRKDGLSEEDTGTFPELLLRIGTAKDFELRFTWVGYINNQSNTEKDSSGLSNVSFGMKQTIVEGTESLFDLGYILELGLPTGDSSVSSDKLEPVLKFLWSSELANDFSLGGNLNIASVSAESDRVNEYSYSVSLGTSLTDICGTYLEIFGIIPEDNKNLADSHFINGGFTYLLNSNFQLDVRAGFGLNRASDDLILGAGFSWRV
ncbi:MAG: transporter [Deltaproteobacteria bacterium]|nr:transporter [Deltaproteobacteria bacterium]